MDRLDELDLGDSKILCLECKRGYLKLDSETPLQSGGIVQDYSCANCGGVHKYVLREEADLVFI